MVWDLIFLKRLHFFLQREWTYKTNTNWYITYIDIKVVEGLS